MNCRSHLQGSPYPVCEGQIAPGDVQAYGLQPGSTFGLPPDADRISNLEAFRLIRTLTHENGECNSGQLLVSSQTA